MGGDQTGGDTPPPPEECGDSEDPEGICVSELSQAPPPWACDLSLATALPEAH